VVPPFEASPEGMSGYGSRRWEEFCLAFFSFIDYFLEIEPIRIINTLLTERDKDCESDERKKNERSKIDKNG
jgi:hypothetical protein